MKETTFIEQNKKKWARFEQLSTHNKSDPDELSELFTEITEDLSYARTFYPRRSVRVYLNQLAQGIFTKLYRQKKRSNAKLKLPSNYNTSNPIMLFFSTIMYKAQVFWTETIPLELYRMRFNLLAAVIFFTLSVLLGAVSQHYDSNFVNIILGETYVDMTEKNILENNPMGVYGTSPQTSMFFMITINNIKVAFLTFALGIFASFGTYLILLSNGIMLGCFQWWFKAKGLLLTTFLAIWIHGAFEISAIIIAGAAGITVGNGLLFPKSYSRLQSLVFSAKRGLLVMLSLIPIFIIAGALESFVTRHYLEMPTLLKWGIILTSFGLIILYYGIYPFIIARRHPEKIDVKEVPRFIPERKINFSQIRKAPELFSDAFYLFMTKTTLFIPLLFKFILPISIGIGVISFSIHFSSFDYTLDWNEIMNTLFGFGNHFNFIIYLTWPIPIALIIALTYFTLNPKIENHSFTNYIKSLSRPFVWLYLYALFIFSIFLIPNWFLIFLIILFLGPIFFLIPSYILIERKNIFKAIAHSFSFQKNSYGNGIGYIFFLTLITSIFFLVLNNPFQTSILSLLNEFLRDILVTNIENYRVVINAFDSIIYLLFFGLMLIIVFTSSALFYFSNDEKKNANGLYKRLALFGTRNRNFETKSDFE